MICFDIGNVLIDVDFKDFLAVLRDGWGISEKETWTFLTRIQHLQDVGDTDMTRELRDWFDIDVAQHPKVLDAWHNSAYPNSVSMKHFEEIIDEYDSALLSNMGHDHLSIIEKKIGSKAMRKCHAHFSCTVGAAKPTLKYYRLFLEQRPEFQGAIYIDDRFENLEAGKKMGFDARHLNTPDHDADSLERFWLTIKESLKEKK